MGHSYSSSSLVLLGLCATLIGCSGGGGGSDSMSYIQVETSTLSSGQRIRFGTGQPEIRFGWGVSYTNPTYVYSMEVLLTDASEQEIRLFRRECSRREEAEYGCGNTGEQICIPDANGLHCDGEFARVGRQYDTLVFRGCVNDYYSRPVCHTQQRAIELENVNLIAEPEPGQDSPGVDSPDNEPPAENPTPSHPTEPTTPPSNPDPEPEPPVDDDEDDGNGGGSGGNGGGSGNGGSNGGGSGGGGSGGGGSNNGGSDDGSSNGGGSDDGGSDNGGSDDGGSDGGGSDNGGSDDGGSDDGGGIGEDEEPTRDDGFPVIGNPDNWPGLPPPLPQI